MAARIHRTTLFKIPDPEDRKQMLQGYKQVAKDQIRDGKPYILSLCAGEAHEDSRSDGYTIVGQSEFASLEDMKYYDDHCPAHAALRAIAATLNITQRTTVYFTGTATVPLE